MVQSSVDDYVYLKMEKTFVYHFRNSFKTLSDKIKVQDFTKRNLTFVLKNRGKITYYCIGF